MFLVIVSKTILNNILVQRVFSSLHLLTYVVTQKKTNPSRNGHLPARLKIHSINQEVFSAGSSCCIHFLLYSPPYYRQFWVICLSASTNRIIKHAVHYSFVSEKSLLRDSPFKIIPPFPLLCSGQGSGRKDRHAVCNVREAHWWEAPPH